VISQKTSPMFKILFEKQLY